MSWSKCYAQVLADVAGTEVDNCQSLHESFSLYFHSSREHSQDKDNGIFQLNVQLGLEEWKW